MHVTFDDAQQAIAAALRKAEQLGTLHRGGGLRGEFEAFARMNDAWVGSIDIAIKKAKTACFFGMPPVRSAGCPSQADRCLGLSIPMRVNYLPRRASYCEHGRRSH